ncbi:hypothetical protein ERN12_08430 [Rhodobacteraceae bacterium]|nr:hypothetical protein ERN12_08430 [Paracoccaceae bacterium]
MTDARTVNLHAALAGRMARTVGVDLARAGEQGLVDPPAWKAAVERCTQCGDPAACAGWLSAQLPPEDLDACAVAKPSAPAFCNNRLMFDRLNRLIER